MPAEENKKKEIIKRLKEIPFTLAYEFVYPGVPRIFKYYVIKAKRMVAVKNQDNIIIATKWNLILQPEKDSKYYFGLLKNDSEGFWNQLKNTNTLSIEEEVSKLDSCGLDHLLKQVDAIESYVDK